LAYDGAPQKNGGFHPEELEIYQHFMVNHGDIMQDFSWNSGVLSTEQRYNAKWCSVSLAQLT
jgi:hypothetical protein